MVPQAGWNKRLSPVLLARAQLKMAQAARDLATYKRCQNLFKGKVISAEDFGTAADNYGGNQAVVTAEQANVDRLEALEAFKIIRAPFDGTVTARNTDIGAYVPAGSGTPLFRMAATSRLRVVRSLAARWNARRKPSVDACKLLNQAPTPGVLRYCKVHEDNIAGDTPYAQIAIEYEVEMLPMRYGELLLTRCVEMLGAEILPCLSFVTEHIYLDVGHTNFNARGIAKLIDLDPSSIPALVSAGTAALDAYAQFLGAELADQDSR